MTGAARATKEERERLNRRFAELCRIASPTGQERRCADRIAADLRALGLEVSEDDAGAAAGSDCGNLLTRIPAADPAAPSLLLCAHMDTVPLLAPVEPVLEDGKWENANEGILGADNKAAVAVLLEVAERCTRRPGPVALELLFTVHEEQGLKGAHAFDTSVLRSSFGYVFDHASPIGEIVLAAPTYHRVIAELHGAAAHAGLRPEAGRNAIAAAAKGIAAMELGRLDHETTANIGVIAGGTAPNVVAERCRVEGEARSIDAERVEAVVANMIDRFQDAADAAECDLDVTVERLFQGYRTRPDAPAIGAAEAALRACGYQPTHITTGGGSDANAFLVAGLECVNLANGTERNHQPDEAVSVAALEGMLDVTFALLGAAAA